MKYVGGNYKTWLKSLKNNPFHPRSQRIMRRRIGRWIRRFEKRHRERSKFRMLENAKRF